MGWDFPRNMKNNRPGNRNAVILIHFFKQSQILNGNTHRSHQKGITRRVSQKLLLQLVYLRIYITIVSNMGAVFSLEQ